MEKDLSEKKLSECSIEDVIKHFGAESILDEIDSDDLADYVESCSEVINKIDTSVLLDHIPYSDLIDCVGTSDMIEELELRGYNVTNDEDGAGKLIVAAVRELMPNGYIDKEDAIKILSDDIRNSEYNFNKGF